MELPGRYSLLWRLSLSLVLFCLLLVSLQVELDHELRKLTSFLPESSRLVLAGYGQEAEEAWRSGGALALDEFLDGLTAREQVWAVVVDGQNRSLSSHPLREAELERLRLVRRLDDQIGRADRVPTFIVPFSDGSASLMMKLPERLDPRRFRPLWEMAFQLGVPLILAAVFGFLLYRQLIVPLVLLRRQAAALSAGDLDARIGAPVVQRRDELGRLAGAFNYMAGRLDSTLTFQRQLLRDLSHELRTPLSRLRVAGEQAEDLEGLRDRLARELAAMEALIADSLELVWLDTEQPALACEPVDIVALWGVLTEDACYESGWTLEQLPCALPADCRVWGNLNALARAMENILRNAIRHSSPDGRVTLGGRREGDSWLLWIDDEGPGVAEDELELIFQPFTRLNAARPGGDGFGLGLAIARSSLRLQGADLWAQSLTPGLRISFRLKSV